MSDVINSIFGRAKNEPSRPGEYGAVATPAPSTPADTPETVVPQAIETEQAEPVAEVADAGQVATSAEDAAETAGENETTEDATAEDAIVESGETETGETAEGHDDEASADDEAEADTEEAADAEDSDDLAEDDEAVDEPVDEDTDEAVADEDVTADEDDVSTDEPESAAVESGDAPTDVAAEPAADDADLAEVPDAVTAEARPAAGTRGSTTVGDGVVAEVVSMLARKADGVHDLGTEGVSAEVDGEVATIKVSLVVEFGHAVKALAEQIRVSVIEAVEQFLGLDVEVVDVHIAGIHLPDAS